MSQKKILIVEDEMIVALDLKNRLTKLGYTVPALAASGEEALAMLANMQPDLVLMDIKLTGKMDGVTAARQIKEQNGAPVIYLTAYADQPTLQRAKITEPYGYLIKPFEEKELHSTIEMALYKHQMEQQLKQHERWLAATLKSIGDGVITVDTADRITFMNPTAEQLTGWTVGQALGRPVRQVCHVVTRETPDLAGQSAIKTLQGKTLVNLSQQLLLIAKDGAEIPIDRTKATIVDDQGTVSGAVWVFRDVTERQRLEQALVESEAKYRQLAFENTDLLQQARREAEAKTILLREVTHRVKNNLAAIIGLLYIQKSHVSAGLSAGSADCQAILDDLIGRIQGIATVHKVLTDHEWQPLPLAELAAKIIQTALKTLPPHRHVLVEVSPSPLQVTPSEANSLALLLNELTTNVIKYALSPAGPTEIKVQISGVNEQIVLQFRDNGPGYPAGVLQGAGDNVGLMLVRHLASHGLKGQITLHNDQGAVITVRFKSEPAAGTFYAG
jgi:PAS domain S-box-containing protein